MDRELLDSALRQIRVALEAVSIDAPEVRATVRPVLEAIATAEARLDTPPTPGAHDDARNSRIAQLEHEVAARDEFIATMAHELRNPLSPLIFQTRLMIGKFEAAAAGRHEVSPEWTLSQVRRFEQQLHRVLATLDRLLDVSRLSTGRIDLALEAVDLGAVMREVVFALEAELAVAQSEARVHEGRRAVGLWDRVRIEQVCRNLLSNAVRYGAGGPIDITIDADDDFAMLDVRDYGVGIAREHQQRIFERFERAHTDRRSGGFGIGLWVVRNICAALGGTINVESQIGQGARFSVVLPRRIEPARRGGVVSA